MRNFSLPALSDTGLTHYIDEVNQFPMLEDEEEYILAKAWVDHEDTAAAHKLVTSHLRLVVKIAMGYRGYGLPLADLISEGNVGLMQAVKRFDPEKGFRVSTYAMWWIKASIQEYVLRSWSLVKMGTTAAQKKLFFNLRKMKNRIFSADDSTGRNLTPSEISSIADELDVPERDVIEMDARLGAHDPSLNTHVSDDSESEWIDYLEDKNALQEETFGAEEEHKLQTTALKTALNALNNRERDIIEKRRLKDDPDTLEDLSQIYKISRERVRQIEVRAIEKLQENMRKAA